jgi:hypothetical protein
MFKFDPIICLSWFRERARIISDVLEESPKR